jgi:predicted transcriptional regulator
MTQHSRNDAGAPREAVRLPARLPAELADALRNYAFVTDTSINDVIKQAVAEYLKNHAHTEMVRAAFEKALSQHALAFKKLEEL